MRKITKFVGDMKKIPKIVLDEAERQGLDRMAAHLCDRMAAHLCDVDGRAIYSLGVESKERWFPCPPDAPVLVSLKDGEIEPFDDLGLIAGLLETS